MIDVTLPRQQHLLSDIYMPNHPRCPHGYLKELPVFEKICTKCNQPFETVEYTDHCLFCQHGVKYNNKTCLNCHEKFTAYDNQDYCGSCTFFSLQQHWKIVR